MVECVSNSEMRALAEDLLERTYHGLEAVEIYRLIPGYPQVFDLIMEILGLSYSIHLSSPGERFISSSLEELRQATREFELRSVLSVFKRSRAAWEGSGFSDTYARYKEGSLNRSLAILGREALFGTVVDVGADSNKLGMILLDSSRKVSRVIGIDIEDRNAEVEPGRLDFIVAENPGQLPIEDELADVVMCRFSLHHMSHETQQQILIDARRILKPQGKIVILEDTVSSDLVPLANNYCHQRFLDFSSDLERRMALSFLDASSCFVFEETMPFTFTFRTVEEWEDQLSALGYRRVTSDYWGIPFFSLFQAPLGVLVYEKA